MSSIPGDSTFAGAPDGSHSRDSASEARASARATAQRHRRPLGNMVMHAPQILRALVRADEVWLVALSAVVGAFAGLMVWFMTEVTQLIHELLFAIPPTTKLSAMSSLVPWRALLVPSLGGLVFGVVSYWVSKKWPRRSVDAIEANALYGGRMSLNDGITVMVQTIASSGVGASVGLEGGYTQIGAAIGSRFGRSFRLRRNDMRLLVGCGAAGAIGSAFHAPLTGAFYAFELIIGTYTLATFAPVAVASIVAYSVVNALGDAPFEIRVDVPPIEGVDFIPLLALGMVCALVGIAIMRGVTLTEALFRHSGVPVWLRPACAGVPLGIMALASPAVLSSGHGALGALITAPLPLANIAMIVVFKAAGSAISLGSGFRGGLFFCSLFLGMLTGKLFAGLLALVTKAHAVPAVVCSLVGMSAMAVAIIGGPLTMGFLALETTGSLPLTTAVLAACVISALTVRRTFGYSFATWRFHLRGEAIRSAVDIGWMRNLTVGRMMRREVRTVRGDTPLSAFKRDFPLGAAQRVVVLDADDRYGGIVHPSDAHADEDEGHNVGDVVHYADTVLLPQMTIKEAVAMFENAESDALAVVDGPETRHVIGLLTEQYALRRYSEELDRRRRELSGE
jgi:chloride channel protein, CIC family